MESTRDIDSNRDCETVKSNFSEALKDVACFLGLGPIGASAQKSQGAFELNHSFHKPVSQAVTVNKHEWDESHQKNSCMGFTPAGQPPQIEAALRSVQERGPPSCGLD